MVRQEEAPSVASRTGQTNELLAAATSIIPQPAVQGDPTLLNGALWYASLGLRVIPCEPGGKKPVISDWPNRASDDPTVIRQWWAWYPNANIGLLTGYGIDVLDVDVKDGRNGMQMMEYVARFGLLRNPIAVIRTPSGGLHLWYRASGGRCGAVGAHRELEFKGWRSNVLAPPSVIDGRRYEVIEVGDGTGVLDWAAIKRLFRPATRDGAPKRLRYGDVRSLERLARYVANAPEGNRNNLLFWAACEARRCGFDDLTPLAAAAGVAGLPDDEIMRTLASAEQRQPLPSPADQGGGIDE